MPLQLKGIHGTNHRFRFHANGAQSDEAYVLCPTPAAVKHVVHKVQEIPVPRKRVPPVARCRDRPTTP